MIICFQQKPVLKGKKVTKTAGDLGHGQAIISGNANIAITLNLNIWCYYDEDTQIKQDTSNETRNDHAAQFTELLSVEGLMTGTGATFIEMGQKKRKTWNQIHHHGK